MDQDIRYCTTSDGVEIAYAMTGSGPPLVRALGWFTHLEYEMHTPFWRTFTERLSEHYTFIRYDGRGMGLSYRGVDKLLPEMFTLDLAAVVEATGYDRVAIMGISQGGAPAIAYTAANPDKVSHLIVYGSFVRSYMETSEASMFSTLVRQGWGSQVPAHRQFFSGLFMPDNPSQEDLRTFNELQRISAEPELVASMFEMPSYGLEQATEALSSVKTPTMVLHRRNDAVVPFEEGRFIAARIPGARFVPLEGANHAPTENDGPTWDAMVRSMTEFYPPRPAKAPEATSRADGGFRTILFTDLVGHTEMMRRLGDDKGREVLREHERITREVLREHGGTEVKTMGDGFMASFGSVTKAVQCAVALQRAFDHASMGASEPLSVRVGLNAGEPIEDEGDLFGSTVIMAARVAAKAEGGEILATDVVRGLCSGKGFLFADRGEFVAKGFEEPVRLCEVSWRS